MDALKQLFKKWELILEGEGLKALTDNYRNSKEKLSTKNPVTDYIPEEALQSNAYNGNYEFYSLFKQYCEYYNYDFKCMQNMHSTQKNYLIVLLEHYVEGQNLIYLYKELCDYARLARRKQPYTRIYFYKKIQVIKQEFLREICEFSDYMQFIKYDWSLNPVSYEQFKKNRSRF